MKEICEDAAASVGPVILFAPPSSFMRLVDAGVLELLVRVAELLRDRDRLRPVFSGRLRIGLPEPSAGVDSCDASEPLEGCSSLVSPHAARTPSPRRRPTAASSARSAAGYRDS